jgi:hypothetical protein
MPKAAQAVLNPVEIFRARAMLWAAGEFDLREAVDKLQADAEASGLVAQIGQDAVQAIMATAFAAVRKTPREFPDPVEDEQRTDRGVARSTIAAVEFLIRENGPARLRAFIAKHDARDRAAITEYLRNREARPCRSHTTR